MESLAEVTTVSASVSRFQFPSNGKVHGKYEGLESPETGRDTFQFPSNGKVHGKGGHVYEAYIGSKKFQFPSNGKVHGKCTLHTAMERR